MEIVIKGFDFSNLAVKKLGVGYSANILGKALTTGEITSSSNDTRTEVIPITESMRQDGFVILRSRHYKENPVVVFYNSNTPSTSSFVNYYNNEIYENVNVYIESGSIPSQATHFIVNGYKDSNTCVFENYLDDVTSDYGLSNGVISNSGIYITDDNWTCSRLIPIDNSLTYLYKFKRCAVYDANKAFIKILSPRINIANIKFENNVKFIRLCIEKTDGDFYLKY